MRMPWTTKELERLVNLVAEGKTNRQAARILGRSYESIRSQTFIYGMRQKQEKTPLPIAAIERDELPEWYALGWRVSDFGEGGLWVTWPHKADPRWPSQKHKFLWEAA